MYNHKLRGRPDDPKNKAISAAKKSLEQTIQVNSLSRFAPVKPPPKEEVARVRRHYKEFTKSYQQRYADRYMLRTPPETQQTTAPIAPPPRKKPIVVKESPYLDRYKLAPQPPPSRAVSIVESKHIGEHPSTAVTSPPAKSNNSAVVDSWTTAAEALYSRCPNDVQAMMLIEHLKQMEAAYLQPTKPTETVGTQMMLQQAEKEAHVAHDQLQAIQKLLKADKSTTRSVEAPGEEEAQHPRARKKNAAEQAKKKMRDARKRGMVLTLNTLNQRIQQMHEKYFNEPRFKYASLSDVKRMKKFEESIETLYRNNEFDPKKEISDVMMMAAVRPASPQQRTIESSCHMRRERPVPIARRSISVPMSQHQFCADVSSDNYLLNRNVRKQVRFTNDVVSSATVQSSDEDVFESAHGDDYGDWIRGVEDEYAPPPGQTTVIMPAKSESVSSAASSKVNVLLSPRDMESSASTMPSIQESILKSEFLMKTFDLNTKDLSAGLANFERTQPQGNRPSCTPIASLQEFFSATSQKSATTSQAKKTYMEDSIRSQLKNSLYDIF